MRKAARTPTRTKPAMLEPTMSSTREKARGEK